MERKTEAGKMRLQLFSEPDYKERTRAKLRQETLNFCREAMKAEPWFCGWTKEFEKEILAKFGSLVLSFLFFKGVVCLPSENTEIGCG